MRTIQLLATMSVLAGFVSVSAQADQLMVYPKKGQSAQQQQKDKAACYSWAQQQLGYDPETLLRQSQQAGGAASQAPQQGGAARGAAKGAAAGALGGAIGGDAGKGAEIGAGVGAVGGAHQKNKSEREQKQMEQQASAEVQKKLDAFDKAQGTCLTGKGYSVG